MKILVAYNPLSNNSGFMAIILAAASALAIAFSATLIGRENIPRISTKVIQQRTSLGLLSHTVSQLIRDANTVTSITTYSGNSSAFDCISTTCTHEDKFEISLVDANGVVISEAAGDQGFNLSGSPCPVGTNFGDPGCKYQVKLFWQADCGAAATCNDGILVMRAELFVHIEPGDPNINTQEFTVQCNAGQMNSPSGCQ